MIDLRTRNQSKIYLIEVTVLLSLALLVFSTSVRADKVTDWNVIGNQAVLNANRGGAIGLIDMAYMHIPVYDAVNAINGNHYASFAVRRISVPTGASADAAVVEASYRTLLHIFPTQSAYLNAEYVASMATVPDGQAKIDGIAVGALVATRFLAMRAGDGYNAIVTYTPPVGPGAWVPNTPGTIAQPWVAYMRPFAIDSPDQFLPESPPSMTSDQWVADFNEVKLYGTINSTVRTPDQTTLGRFFLAPGTAQIAEAVRQVSADKGLNMEDNARLFARVYVSGGDAVIAGFNAKLYYSYWRPITAIRGAARDRNPNTEPDPAWTPLAATPNHPEYPSAHAFATGASMDALREFFGTGELNLTMSSPITGTTMTFSSTTDVLDAVTEARILAGFHYRTSCVRGNILGQRVARYVAARYFHPAH